MSKVTNLMCKKIFSLWAKKKKKNCLQTTHTLPGQWKYKSQTRVAEKSRNSCFGTWNVVKFQTLVACQKGLDNQCRPRSDCFWRSCLIRVFPVCHADKYFVNSSHNYQHFIWEQKEKSIQNFRKYTACFVSVINCTSTSDNFLSFIFADIHLHIHFSPTFFLTWSRSKLFAKEDNKTCV